MIKHHTLRAHAMGIDTHDEPVVFMRQDCPVCRAEGFSANTRLAVSNDGKNLIATLNIVENDKFESGYIGLSNFARDYLQCDEGQILTIKHAPVVHSLSSVRKKIFGHTLSEADITDIITDISDHKYSDIEISSFLSVCAGGHLNLDEITALTRAMVACGKHLEWPGNARVYDKHCVGGLPGNRTTPIVVAIVSAAGLMIPKTSSRAITSPAGTADTMETLMDVNLSLDQLHRVVSETGACLAWGGSVNLSPADDMLIRIERALNLDGEGQLIASVLSKKIAAGSTHTLIDIPVGPSAKVRNQVEAERLSWLFNQVGEACGMHVRTIITDGSQPIGHGLGPVEEARDVMAVLLNSPEAPADLREKSLLLAAHLLDMAELCGLQKAQHKVQDILSSGEAWEQFQRIASAQGGLKSLPPAGEHFIQTADKSGQLIEIDNRKLARLAKLAGAPFDPRAGLRLNVRVGDHIEKGQALFSVYSSSQGERDYAMAFFSKNPDMFVIS